MASKLTKEQAKALLAAYTQQQTAAAQEAIAAYDRARDAEVDATAAETQHEAAEVQETARAALDTAAVKALIEQYAVADALAGMGLSRSGTAQSGVQAVTQAQQTAVRTANEQRRRALSVLSQKLLTARNTAEAKKQQNAASVRQNLTSKIAEKTLTLNKSVG